MAYFLRQEKKKERIYLQMYESYWDKDKKQPRSRSIEAFGYLSLFLLRIMEIKCFKNQINSYNLINFMRNFRVVDKGNGSFVNISRNQAVNEKVKKLTGLTTLDALYLSETEVENFFKTCMQID